MADVVGRAMAASAQWLLGLQQQNYDRASQSMAAFVSGSSAHVTERGCDETNIIDQGGSKTYAFDDGSLSELYHHLENCRRSGSMLHFSEKQGSPLLPFSGLMLDFDLALGARPTKTMPVLACGGVARNVPAVLDERSSRRLCELVVRMLARDLIMKSPSGNEDLDIQMFFIVRPEVDPIKYVFPDGKEGTAYKYGFHILVPGVRTTRGYKKYLIGRLREDEALTKILSRMGVIGVPGGVPGGGAPRGSGPGSLLRDKVLNPVAACLDQNSASVPVLFLGSCKRGGKVYPLGAAYSLQGDVADFQSGAFSVHPIPDAVLARYNMCYELSLWARPPLDVFRQPRDLISPLADSTGLINPSWDCGLVTPRNYEFREEISARVVATADRLAGGILAEDEFRETEHRVEELCRKDRDAEYIQQLLSLLDAEYSSEYEKWRNVMFAVYNTASTSLCATPDDYYSLAEWFSQRCPDKWSKGGREGLRTLWDGAGDNQQSRKNAGWRPLSRKSIAFWAKQCSPAKFREISRNTYHGVLGNYVYKHCGLLQHAMVAEILHIILGDRFAVDIATGNSGAYRYLWYEFVSAGQPMKPGEIWKWRPEAEPDELHKFMSGELVEIAGQIAKDIQERKKDATDDVQAKYYKELDKNFGRTLQKLYDNSFKKFTIEQARYLFRRRDFLDRLDRDADIIGVANGILRLASTDRPESQLISSYHEWPVSRFTTVKYKKFDPRDPMTRILLDALKKIVPELDMRIWLMMFLATGLYHGLKDPVMLFWTGSGANAKTFVARMAAVVLGDYSTKLPIALLTAEREDPNKPNSAVMRLKNRGLGYFEESNKCEVLNTSRVKEVVNPGEMTASDKHKAQEVFDNTATLISLSNYSFIIESKDQGTWRRIRYYRAKAKFCPTPDPINPYEHKDDKRFITEYVNDPDCQSAFLGIMVFFWERLQRDYKGVLDNVPCPTLDYETEEFRNSQDVLNRFITERVIASPHNDHLYPLAFVSARFCEWYMYNIEASSRRYVATEVIGDIENSVLSRFLTSVGSSKFVSKCRILSDADITEGLKEGESYVGGRGTSTFSQVTRFGPHGDPEPDAWWNWSCLPTDPPATDPIDPSSAAGAAPLPVEFPPAAPLPVGFPPAAPMPVEFPPAAPLPAERWADNLVEDQLMSDSRLRQQAEQQSRDALETQKMQKVSDTIAQLLLGTTSVGTTAVPTTPSFAPSFVPASAAVVPASAADVPDSENKVAIRARALDFLASQNRSEGAASRAAPQTFCGHKISHRFMPSGAS